MEPQNSGPNQEVHTSEEKEFLCKIKEIGSDKVLGNIDPHTPKALYNYLKTFLVEKTGLGFYEIDKIPFFDFCSVLYIVIEEAKEEQKAYKKTNIPKGKLGKKSLGQ
ncbi:MAG: hypothetical protein QHH15_06220 [Candidatus Thermoplasmatota archaeon]|nr:hypothetical protein [Candidatus Thermoplasmatota archaeon]